MKQSVKNKKGELLFEIGTEEVPSSYLSLLGTTSNLNELTKAVLKETLFDVAHEAEIACYQTPCRLVILITNLPPVFEKKEEIFGPKKALCYASDGKPSPTLEGFLKSKQASLKELVEEGERVVIRRVQRKATRDALKQVPLRLIQLLGFPKMMRWDGSDLRFPRPIRWLVCVYNGEVLSVRFGNLKTDRKTYGVRPDRLKKSVRYFGDYARFLKKEGILLERCGGDGDSDRKRFIHRQLESQFQKLGGFPESLNRALLDEVTNLVEKPVLFSGHFDKKFLKLPKEILIASLSKYQRLFSVENRKGDLLPCFVACANGSPVVSKVKKNYEHVLNARLEDANFFFEEDTKEPFSQKRKKLKLLIYHQKLGTMYDKSERMKKLAAHLARALRIEGKDLLRACELSKNDLVTEMVKEFPSLQGTVGSYYARKSGESEEIALALREQYLDLPKSIVGSGLAFLEKLDYVAGCFYAGETPTGSSDPYGLRRAANTLLKIILNQKWKISLEEMIKANSELFDRSLTAQQDRTERLSVFLTERLKGIFKEEDFRDDLIEAIVTKNDRPVQMREKLSALKEMMAKQPDDFLSAFKVVERTHNILKPVQPKEKEGIGSVQPDLFQDEIEKSLWNIYNSKKESIEKLIHENAWAQATAQYGVSFSEKLHQFFEKVLVNVEDPDIRRNRFAMMKEINELYTKPIADLSKLIMNLDPKNR